MEEDDQDPVQGGLLRGHGPLPTLRPENHRPWDTERPGGWTLSQARLELVSFPHRNAVAMLLAMWDAGVWDSKTEEAWLREFWRDVLARLQRGELQMKARPVGNPTIQDIPPDLLDDAEPDFDANRITCCGLTFGAVRIFTLSPLTIDAAPLANLAPLALSPPAAPPERAREWMEQNVTSYVPNQRDKRVKECGSALGILKKHALDGWTTLPEAIKGKPRASGR